MQQCETVHSPSTCTDCEVKNVCTLTFTSAIWRYGVVFRKKDFTFIFEQTMHWRLSQVSIISTCKLEKYNQIQKVTYDSVAILEQMVDPLGRLRYF